MRLGESMIRGDKVNLRDKRLADARKDYVWQTDTELTRLDAAPLITSPFSQYLLDYSVQLLCQISTRHLFSIETLDGEHIGNCTYYGIDEAKGEAEIGIMIGERSYWDNGYGTDAVTALVNHVFSETNLRRIHLKTLYWNKRAQSCFQKCGFAPCGHLVCDGYDFMVMELLRKQWKKNELKRRNLLSGG